MDQGYLSTIFLWAILRFAEWEFEYKVAIRFVYLAKLVFLLSDNSTALKGVSCGGRI